MSFRVFIVKDFTAAMPFHPSLSACLCCPPDVPTLQPIQFGTIIDEVPVSMVTLVATAVCRYVSPI